MPHIDQTRETMPVRLCICIATFRRPHGLQRALEGISGQSFARIPKPVLRIVVADNEGNARVEEICRDFQAAHPIPVTYVHEDRPGIAFTRNASLRQVPSDTEFVVIFDDDEIPDPDWLEQLLIVQAATDADVVHGPTVPLFEANTPTWIKESGYFEKPRNQSVLIDRQSITGAATSNVLMRYAMLIDSEIRFDPQFGLSGGSDKVIFRDLSRAGYQIIWAANARVREVVPVARSTLRYIWESEYRGGNLRPSIWARDAEGMEASEKPALFWKSFKQSWKNIGTGLARLLMLALSLRLTKVRFVKATLPIAFGTGMLTNLFGARFEHYRQQRSRAQ